MSGERPRTAHRRPRDPSRETLEQKALRYGGERRLLVVAVGDRVVAVCRGSDRIDRLGFDPAQGDWQCDCPAARRCAHLAALQMVVTRPHVDGAVA